MKNNNKCLVCGEECSVKMEKDKKNELLSITILVFCFVFMMFVGFVSGFVAATETFVHHTNSFVDGVTKNGADYTIDRTTCLLINTVVGKDEWSYSYGNESN